MINRITFLAGISFVVYISASQQRNNVCTSFTDYYWPDDNPNCYYDPDTTLTPPEVIKKYAGNVETHHVTAPDGYIVTLFRIPLSPAPKGVILLHHSIATSSHIYLWQGNSSLALSLWRRGFDVWLANQRGTTYSDKHVNMSSSDFEYWNFGAHEMGYYDVSTELELIRRKTKNSKVIYLGHSLGSGVGLIYASLKPVESKKFLRAMILLSPPFHLEYVTSPIALFKRTLPQVIETLRDALHIGSPLYLLPILFPISRIVLRNFPVLLYVVNAVVLTLIGYTPDEVDPTFFNYDAVLYGNNFSWKTLLHFLQISNALRFQMYDYGEENNLRMYGQKIPPLYPVDKITVPTLLVSSYDDSLVPVNDTEDLFNALSPEAKVYGHWKLSGLNHLDFHTGLHRRELFVNKLFDFLDNL